MSWELFDIRHKLCLATRRRGAADSPGKRYCLARHLTVEGSQDQLVRYCLVEDVEASPVCVVAGARQGVEGVPEKRGSIRRIAGARMSQLRRSDSVLVAPTHQTQLR